MFSSARSLLGYSLLLAVVAAGSLPAQQESQPKPRKKATSKSNLAITDPAEADADFQFQGEYLGRSGPSSSGQLLGVQVVAKGDGEFDAYLLRGGLPGAGWDRRTKVALSGSRADDNLQVANSDWKIDIDGREALLYDSSGRLRARLPKIHRISATQDASPIPGAIVLFDGSNVDQFDDAEITPDGLLAVGAMTKMKVQDFQMHVEFRTPYMPYAREQGRGNSGVYIQQRYEVQILDSFGLEGVENECGGLYKQKRPDVNMCFPPLSWQTYDIYFTASRWSADGQKQSDARITVLHNGEPIHSNYAITAKTGGGKVEGPEPFPILFQNHNNPVTFRNIWLAPLSSAGYAADAAESNCPITLSSHGSRGLLDRLAARRVP